MMPYSDAVRGQHHGAFAVWAMASLVTACPGELLAPSSMSGGNSEAAAQQDAGTGPSSSVVDLGAVGTMQDSGLGGSAAPFDMMSPSTDAGDAFDDPDAGARIPVFIAQGHVGRTIMSCDDGQTWVENRSFDIEGDALVCGLVQDTRCYGETSCSFVRHGNCETSSSECDCDHHPGAAQGLAYGAGAFVATFGWGTGGAVLRSEDGVQWTVVDSGHIFSGIDFGNDTFVLADRAPLVSVDGGRTWSDGGAADHRSPGGEVVNNVRVSGFLPEFGGRFVATAESGGNRSLMVSSDNGASWTGVRADTRCMEATRGFASGNGVTILSTARGIVCRSVDGGVSWSLVDLEAPLDTAPVFAHQTFMVWGDGRVWISADGLDWSSRSLSIPRDFRVGAVAVSETTGTLVAVRGGWQNWYGEQRFFRSPDGVTWTALAEGDFVGSHRISYITFGYAQPSVSCPGP
ncbi:MAG: WD40/YVTN/BNR-like repeat-containing protein [Myxococcota bacterium]